MNKFLEKMSFLKKIDVKAIWEKIKANTNKNTVLIAVAVLAVIVTGVLIFGKSYKGFSLPNIFGYSAQQVGQKSIDYINNNQLSQEPATLVSVSKTSGLVKIRIKIGESEFDSYATSDGKLLFPQAFEMEPKEDAASDGADNSEPVSLKKSDSPMLEAFVVARCPYGLQIQRAMADAVKNMPALGQYIKARYIGDVSGNTITAMHGDAEAKENLRQICIREEQPTKYWNYVSCQMKTAGIEVSCEQSTGVDSTKLNACTSDPSKGVAYAKKDFDLAAQYDASGSPTLILNGVTISESSYGGRSSDGVKSMACAGFNSPASFCSTALNKTAAAVSFSATYAGTASGSADDSANCAPAQ